MLGTHTDYSAWLGIGAIPTLVLCAYLNDEVEEVVLVEAKVGKEVVLVGIKQVGAEAGQGVPLAQFVQLQRIKVPRVRLTSQITISICIHGASATA